MSKYFPQLVFAKPAYSRIKAVNLAGVMANLGVVMHCGSSLPNNPISMNARWDSALPTLNSFN
jgi:hypothetical protein